MLRDPPRFERPKALLGHNAIVVVGRSELRRLRAILNAFREYAWIILLHVDARFGMPMRMDRSHFYKELLRSSG